MNWYLSYKYLDKWVDKQVTKSCSKSVWNVRSIYDKLYLDNIFLTWRNAYQHCRKSISKKKIQIKACYSKLGTKTLSYDEFHCKTMQISEEQWIIPSKMKIV